MKNILFLLIVTGASLFAEAEQIHYEISNEKNVSSMVQFSIPYSMGVHEGSARSLQTSVVTDENEKVVQAQFKVPISSITTGNKERDCHTREALGINYSQSQFPNSHVCNSNYQIPESGPDSVQYSDITVDFQEMSLPAEPFTMGIPTKTDVKVKIKIHGVERTQTWPVMITKTISATGVQGFQLISQFQESLRDFGVQVKPFKLGFISIGVKDTVTVKIAISLVRN